MNYIVNRTNRSMIDEVHDIVQRSENVSRQGSILDFEDATKILDFLQHQPQTSARKQVQNNNRKIELQLESISARQENALQSLKSDSSSYYKPETSARNPVNSRELGQKVLFSERDINNQDTNKNNDEDLKKLLQIHRTTFKDIHISQREALLLYLHPELRNIIESGSYDESARCRTSDFNINSHDVFSYRRDNTIDIYSMKNAKEVLECIFKLVTKIGKLSEAMLRYYEQDPNFTMNFEPYPQAGYIHVLTVKIITALISVCKLCTTKDLIEVIEKDTQNIDQVVERIHASLSQKSFSSNHQVGRGSGRSNERGRSWIKSSRKGRGGQSRGRATSTRL